MVKSFHQAALGVKYYAHDEPRGGAVTACDRSDLCAELSGATETDFSRAYGRPALTRRLSEDHSCAALVDLSPLEVGHSLIVPKRHYLSMAEAFAAEVGVADFATEFLDRWCRVFGPYSVMEHGSSSSITTSACITHAHLHVLPVRMSLVEQTLRSDQLPLAPVENWLELDQLLNGRDVSYFLLAGETSGWISIDPPQRPSQYLRIVAGKQFGVDEALADWATVAGRDNHEVTLSKWNSFEAGDRG